MSTQPSEASLAYNLWIEIDKRAILCTSDRDGYVRCALEADARRSRGQLVEPVDVLISDEITPYPEAASLAGFDERGVARVFLDRAIPDLGAYLRSGADPDLAVGCDYDDLMQLWDEARDGHLSLWIKAEETRRRVLARVKPQSPRSEFSEQLSLALKSDEAADELRATGRPVPRLHVRIDRNTLPTEARVFGGLDIKGSIVIETNLSRTERDELMARPDPVGQAISRGERLEQARRREGATRLKLKRR